MSTPERADDSASTSQELAEIEQRLARAWVAGDRNAIERLLTPDWNVVDITGRLLTKAQVMNEMFGAQDRPIEAMTIDDVTVRVFGDVAVVRGRTVATPSGGQLSAPVVLRFTDVFVRHDGRWVVTASQGTPVTT